MSEHHLATIAEPDTGQQMIVSYTTGATFTTGTVNISIGRIGHDKPDATMQLGSSHVAGLYTALERGVAALVRNLDH
jgi:hypothetical protein